MQFKLLKINKKQSKSREKSRGRSMVEMLGVLAVIGVLTIGGIQGYRYAMTRHQANLLVQEISDIHTRIGMAIDPAVKEPHEIANITDINVLLGSPYDNGQLIKTPFLFYAEGGADDFVLSVEGVPESVCQIATEMLEASLPYKLLTVQKLNGEDKSAENQCQAGNNLLELDGGNGCQWTGWLDGSRPTTTKTGGEYEPVNDVCGTGYAADIVARASMYPYLTIDQLEQHLTLNTTDGLICKNADQKLKPGGRVPMPYCLNYEINVYCCRKRFE